MPYEQSIVVLDDEAVLAECGPMRLVIRAWKEDIPQIDLLRRAAEKSFEFLERIAAHRTTLSQPFPDIKTPPRDALAARMVQSVGLVGDRDLTPMAAVAGTLADAVADWLFEKGLPKVIVDNGGDIAIRISQGQTVTVGIRPQVTSRRISHVIHLGPDRPSWGVTTSGVGGRSLTRGIASAVTVLAGNGSVADAAATAVANACFVKDDGIIQVPAERIDPNSDMTGVLVTTEVGPLSSGKIRAAIERARQKADFLSEKGIIVGAVIALADVYAITAKIRKFIKPV